MLESFFAQGFSELFCVDHYWHMRESAGGYYPLYATAQWGFVFSKLDDTFKAQLIGPRILPANAPYKKGEYFWGVVLHAHIGLKGRAKKSLLNQVIDLPVGTHQDIKIAGEMLKLPRYEQLDEFVAHLLKIRLLYVLPLHAASRRSRQRKLKDATGLSPKQIEQAKRIDYAVSIINGPLSLAQVAAEAGYADQAHMTREFKRLVGHSPLEIRALFEGVNL